MPITAPQFSVNDVGDPEPVIAVSYCKRITVAEDPHASGWPRQWVVHSPGIADGPTNKSAGASQQFVAGSGEFRYRPGQIAGYVETKSGSGATTFNQYEDEGDN